MKMSYTRLSALFFFLIPPERLLQTTLRRPNSSRVPPLVGECH